jgi:hypothetical protein
MKKRYLLLTGLFITIIASILIITHFFWKEDSNNKLLYSDDTMEKLEHIVDSLNLRYKSCDINKVFNSQYQTIGYVVSLDTNDVKQAKRDIDKNISFENFLKKYPNAKVKKNVLIIKNKYISREKKEIVYYDEVNLNDDYRLEIEKENEGNFYLKTVKNSWIYNYIEKSEYSKESIEAFYFPDDFKSVPLPLKYCRQIGYSDCLIDTVATKFKNDAKPGWVDLPKNWMKLSLKKKEKLLDEMRSTTVVGFCSNDTRPIEFATSIAKVSAETSNWEVFLKSHLDIMNDKFERMTDGTYAWSGRKTYIKELEELDINVVDLLFGISLRIENPAHNHYYGRIDRLGRAISESKDKDIFQSQMLSMIEDNELDDYNRVSAYYQFLNYNYFIENLEEQKENLKQLKSSIKKMPSYIKDKIEIPLPVRRR